MNAAPSRAHGEAVAFGHDILDGDAQIGQRRMQTARVRGNVIGAHRPAGLVVIKFVCHLRANGVGMEGVDHSIVMSAHQGFVGVERRNVDRSGQHGFRRGGI